MLEPGVVNPELYFGDDGEAGQWIWTGQGEWALDDQESLSPSHAWSLNPDGLSQQNTDLSLVSSMEINIPADAEYPTLVFSDKASLAIDTTIHVEVSDDGSNSWSSLATYSGLNSFQPTFSSKEEWSGHRLALYGYVGESVLIRFRAIQGSSSFVDSWFIDDIGIIELQPWIMYLPRAVKEAIGPDELIGEVTDTPTSTPTMTVTPTGITTITSTPTDPSTVTPTPPVTTSPSVTPPPTVTLGPTVTPTNPSPPTPTATLSPTLSPSPTISPTLDPTESPHTTGTPTPPPTSEPIQGVSDSMVSWGGLASVFPQLDGEPAALDEFQTNLTHVTIDYSYDELYRLIAADYSTGEFFQYTYDPVGNRLTQETASGTDAYVYDAANRLVDLDGVTFSWDSNGNLLNDGTRDFTYDHANRLTALSDQTSTHSYAYNGLGDRLGQSVDGTSSTYTLDLNTGLTQVLFGGSNTYIYSFRRIGELRSSGWIYYLSDAIGSVRQVSDNNELLSANISYEPFGKVRKKEGDSGSPFAFAGEWQDTSTLVHLRARYYEPTQGRFFQQDAWNGLIFFPKTKNQYVYALNNVVTVTDPTGHWCFLGNDVPPRGVGPCTDEQRTYWGNYEAGIGHAIGGLVERSKISGLSPTTEFFAEAYVLFWAKMWEGDIVQTPIHHADTIFGGDAEFWERLNASIDVWCSTGQPVTEYFLTPYLMVESLSSQPQEYQVIDDLYQNTRLNTQEIRFSQATYSESGALSSGGRYTVEDNVRWLIEHPGQDLPTEPIRVFVKKPYMDFWGEMTAYGHTGNPVNLVNGEIYTLDHRRLVAYIEAGRETIPIVWETDSAAIMLERYKFSTTNGGLTIVPVD